MWIAERGLWRSDELEIGDAFQSAIFCIQSKRNMTMAPNFLNPFVPARINTGPWVGGYSLAALKTRIGAGRVVLPICSLGTAPEELARLGPWVLPPLYHEALDTDLRRDLVAQIRRCFPFYEGSQARAKFRGTLEVVELPPRRPPSDEIGAEVLAFGVDTTVEQHGPHLPLATDTIQTYAVLRQLATEFDGLVVGTALEHGHLTWGLPFGLSIDLTPPLLTRYCLGFVNALMDCYQPKAIFVADVHGSIVHRESVQAALRQSRCQRWAFRWLYEPLTDFCAQRGDMHAGGVETTLVAQINRELVDAEQWPRREAELVAGQMTLNEAVELSADLPKFVREVETRGCNGIVGDLRNRVEGPVLFARMMEVARADVRGLLDGWIEP